MLEEFRAQREMTGKTSSPLVSVSEELADAIAQRRRGQARPTIESIAIELSSAQEDATEILSSGWKRNPNPRIMLKPPLAWDEICSANRSWTFHLHAWEPMASMLTAYGDTGRRELLDYCLALAEDWVAQHPAFDPVSTFAWYDMAVGMRAFRLAYLIDALCSVGPVHRKQIIRLLASLRVHLQVLAEEGQFRAHSNHGIYQAAGQLAAAMRIPELPESASAKEQARDRLRRLVEVHFGEDGVHREHSPAYHLMVLRTLLRIEAGGLLDDPGVTGLLRRAEDAMSWFVAPVGLVPGVGDSDRYRGNRIIDPYISHPALQYATSEGRSGSAPHTNVRAFPRAGYVVAKNGWFAGDAARASSYLLQTCAFHSRVHKHADDLSFVWYARGHDLLADAGRYGYIGRLDPDSELGRAGFYYGDPARIYVESTRAHNCVEIDGRSYPRRGVKPYGSALVSTVHDALSGLVATESAITHFRTIRHVRLLFHMPGSWTIVVDNLLARGGDERHDYVQRFHYGPELDRLEHADGAIRLALPQGSEALTVTALDDADALDPVRGQTEPALLGFVSRRPSELLPVWTTARTRRGVRGATFATLFALVDEDIVPSAFCRYNATARRGHVQWSTPSASHRVDWDRMQGPLTAKYCGSPTPSGPS